MSLYDYLMLGMGAGALAVGFVVAIALAAFAGWFLLILGVVIGERFRSDR